MKYALLGYDTDGSLDRLTAEDKQALHAAHHALHDGVEAAVPASLSVIAHYRARPAQHATSVRLAGGDIVASEGPSVEAGKTLRALYLLEGDDPAAVLDLAVRLPAVRMGGTVEVWPLIEPRGRTGERHRGGEIPSA